MGEKVSKSLPGYQGEEHAVLSEDRGKRGKGISRELLR